MAELSSGAILAGYRIEGIAGRGGMGIVYRATQLSLGRAVALKLIAGELAEDQSFRERFKRESQVAALIDHPNVIPIYEAGEADGQLFITMRYVDGTDFRTMITEEGSVDPARAARIVRQVAAGLDAAHARGLVHRDVKPANILITQDGEDHVYLTDFGLTKQASGSAGGLTKTGQFVGTLDYVAPEQIEGRQVDARTDVYALGCVLFHAVTGAVPYVRDSEVSKMWAHMNDPPPVATEVHPGLPPDLDGVIQRAMAKEHEERFPSAGDLGRAAVAATEGRVPSAPEVSVARGSAAPAGEADMTASPTAAAPTRAAPVEGTAAAATAPLAAAPATPTRRRRAGLRLVLIGVAAVGVAIAALAVAGVFGGGKEKAPPKQDGGRAKSPPTVAATLDVGKGPDGIAVDEQGRIWVTLQNEDKLALLDAGGRGGVKIPVGRRPDSVAVGKGVVWQTNELDNNVKRFQARPDPMPAGTVEVSGAPHGIALGKQLVWVVNTESDSVTTILRSSAARAGPDIGVGPRPRQVAIGEQSVWVTNFGNRTVTRIDVSTSEVIDPAIRVGKNPRGIVEALGSVWVANSGDGTVSRLNPSTGKAVGRAIRVGEGPFGIAVGEGFVWVTSSKGDSVSRIDPSTGKVVGSAIPVGDEPHGIAVGGGAVWVANHGEGTITHIKP